jgi:DNA repair protein RecO (recombination protein O)
MPVLEAEALVLRHYPLADSDRIVVFVTKEFGKIRGVAQGVKKPRNRLVGCLEPLNHIHLELYTREGRELGQIRQAEIVHSYLGKTPSLDQIYAFTYFAELANELVQDNQPNGAFFRLLLAALKAAERHASIESIVRYYEIWCLKLSGLLPNYDYCSNCGKCVKDDGFFAWLKDGQARCVPCSQGIGLPLSATTVAVLQAMERLPPGQFGSLPLAKGTALEIERLTQGLLGWHLEKQMKSYKLLKGALQTMQL